jgi:acyl-[acyl-carrier-protein] desaturase
VDSGWLLAELRPHAERLLERHLGVAREWFPHRFIPWSRGRDFDAEPWDARASGIDHRLRSALILNVVTEDGLPYYVTAMHRLFGAEPPWFDWLRRWTAEEMRHGAAIRDYLMVTRAVDPVALERLRMQVSASAELMAPPTPLDGFVYLALQELATRVAHSRTGDLIDDEPGRRLLHRVARDENLHHLFYRDLVVAALEIVPSQTMVAIDAQVRHFRMPGYAIAGFEQLARDTAEAGVYSAAMFLHDVVEPLVLTHWAGSEHQLDATAAKAHERTMAFIERLRRVVDRL